MHPLRPSWQKCINRELHEKKWQPCLGMILIRAVTFSKINDFLLTLQPVWRHIRPLLLQELYCLNRCMNLSLPTCRSPLLCLNRHGLIESLRKEGMQPNEVAPSTTPLICCASPASVGHLFSSGVRRFVVVEEWSMLSVLPLFVTSPSAL